MDRGKNQREKKERGGIERCRGLRVRKKWPQFRWKFLCPNHGLELILNSLEIYFPPLSDFVIIWFFFPLYPLSLFLPLLILFSISLPFTLFLRRKTLSLGMNLVWRPIFWDHPDYSSGRHWIKLVNKSRVAVGINNQLILKFWCIPSYKNCWGYSKTL